MSPTLEDGDRVLVIRTYPTRWLRNGHIVLVWPWCTDSHQANLFAVTPYIKRVVGLSGETFRTTDVDIPALHRRSSLSEYVDTNQHFWHIPQGYIFVCGDNSTASIDSRSWGPIPISAVLGIVIMKLPQRTRPIQSEVPSHYRESMIGRLAPEFVAAMSNGEQVTLANYAERAVAFVFVRPHCSSCQEAIINCEILLPILDQSGITIILVSLGNATETQAIVDEFGGHMQVLVAPQASNPFANDYGIFGTPSYCFINAQGRIQSTEYTRPEARNWQTIVESWTIGL